MKEIVQITDYDSNLTLLIQQYKDKAKFKGIIQAANLQANDIETAAFEIRDEFWITTAEGTQLDVIGDIQNESRGGKSDTAYRQAIQYRIAVNNGSGEPETIYTALTGIYGATYARLETIGEATLDIMVDVEMSATDFTNIERIVGAGIQVLLHFYDPTIDPFMFDGTTEGKGFDALKFVALQVNPSTGVVNLELNPGTGVENYEILGNDDSGTTWDYQETDGQFAAIFQSS